MPEYDTYVEARHSVLLCGEEKNSCSSHSRRCTFNWFLPFCKPNKLLVVLRMWRLEGRTNVADYHHDDAKGLVSCSMMVLWEVMCIAVFPSNAKPNPLVTVLFRNNAMDLLGGSTRTVCHPFWVISCWQRLDVGWPWNLVQNVCVWAKKGTILTMFGWVRHS